MTDRQPNTRITPAPLLTTQSGIDGSRKLRVLSLFSGIGAYDLGLESAGYQTVAFCEIDAFCRSILAKHWPGVPCYEDASKLTGDILARDGIGVDVIVAGFPCQDISPASAKSDRAGLDGDRSGLWAEVCRLARELGRVVLIVENSADLLHLDGGRHFGRLLGDLAAIGFNAEWHVISAANVDAPHLRERLWIIAYPDGEGQLFGAFDAEMASTSEAVSHPDSVSLVGPSISRAQLPAWPAEPDVPRVDAGATARVERTTALGNLNPPIIVELIGRAILEARRAA